MNKKKALRIFFAGEIFLFGWFYYFGPHGMQAVARIRAENSVIEKKLVLMEREVKELEGEVVAWQTNDFLKEKVAREQLQLARAGEEIYC